MFKENSEMPGRDATVCEKRGLATNAWGWMSVYISTTRLTFFNLSNKIPHASHDVISLEAAAFPTTPFGTFDVTRILDIHTIRANNI